MKFSETRSLDGGHRVLRGRSRAAFEEARKIKKVA